MKTNSVVEIEKAAWYCPSVVRIDIKRTLASTGSASDGSGPTT